MEEEAGGAVDQGSRQAVMSMGRHLGQPDGDLGVSWGTALCGSSVLYVNRWGSGPRPGRRWLLAETASAC